MVAENRKRYARTNYRSGGGYGYRRDMEEETVEEVEEEVEVAKDTSFLPQENVPVRNEALNIGETRESLDNPEQDFVTQDVDPAEYDKFSSPLNVDNDYDEEEEPSTVAAADVPEQEPAEEEEQVEVTEVPEEEEPDEAADEEEESVEESTEVIYGGTVGDDTSSEHSEDAEEEDETDDSEE